jgi:Cu/Ag efflux pump CusA
MLSSTLLTLVVVPAAYSLLMTWVEKLQHRGINN